MEPVFYQHLASTIGLSIDGEWLANNLHFYALTTTLPFDSINQLIF